MEGPQLSAEKLQNLMTQGEQKMKMMQKAVYFAGPSGAGKTTQALLATGATLVASRKKIEEKVPEDTPDDKRKIGNNNIESKTLLPEAFATSSGIYAIDGPGTGDSRSKEHQIANKYYNYRILDSVVEVVFVYVASVNSFDSKASEFLQRIQEFVNMFEDITILEKSFALLITKVRPEDEEDDRKDVNEILNSL